MKKILYFVVFTTLIIFLSNNKAEAAPAPWEEEVGCGADGFLVSNASQHISQIRYLDQFAPGHLNTCIKNATIGAIAEDWSTFLSICPSGYMIPYNNSSPDDFDMRFGCCPSGIRYIYNPDGNTIPFCSTRSNIEAGERSSVTRCSNTSGDPYRCPYDCAEQSDNPCIPKTSTGPAGPFKLASESNDAFFYDATTKYVCNVPNCMVVYGVEDNQYQGDLFDDYTISMARLSCVEDSDTSNDKTCVRGTWFLTSEYEKWKNNLGELIACNDFVDPNEKTLCMTCYQGCPEPNTCSYSSLGCIQTTQNGVIVRIFQIGLGVVGALAIARFIQAALLRQTADPSKIQESYDIITSLIIGLVVLLGSIAILRFIGVDILQMMPNF